MTPSLVLRSIACIASLALAPTLGAQQAVPADLATKIDHVFDRFTRTTPGCGAGLAKDGRPLYVHAYGSSNLEYDVPNTENTVFESGSVAKQFTASAMLLLVADGKLSLDDDIHRYLPEVPSFGGQKITIRNLLTHTSGLRDQWGLLGIEGRGPGTQVHSPATTLDLVVHQKMLNFPPGSCPSGRGCIGIRIPTKHSRCRSPTDRCPPAGAAVAEAHGCRSRQITFERRSATSR